MAVRGLRVGGTWWLVGIAAFCAACGGTEDISFPDGGAADATTAPNLPDTGAADATLDTAPASGTDASPDATDAADAATVDAPSDLGDAAGDAGTDARVDDASDAGAGAGDAGADAGDAGADPGDAGSDACAGLMCSGVCVDPKTDNQNCGTCNTMCPMGAMCVSGLCVCTLPGTTLCTSVCTDTQTDQNNCGACSTSCALANAITACSGGYCQFLACDQGYANCDQMQSNGCETNTQKDANNCGSCTNVCPYGPHSTALCNNGGCGIICDQGWADCDHDPTNGCEINTQTDPNNCGTCFHGCTSSQTCVGGACQP